MFGLGLKSRLRTVFRGASYRAANCLGVPRLYRLNTPERVGVVYHQPTDMRATDRIMIYALVRGLRPVRALEIGVRWGGSARIITNAMEDNGEGRLVGVDPQVETFRAKPRDLHGRYELIRGYSPEVIPRAIESLGGPADFVFIDALHTHDAVLADFRGVMPHLAAGAHILVHDTYHQGICTAVNEMLEEHPQLADCGFVTRNPDVGTPVSYQGLQADTTRRRRRPSTDRRRIRKGRAATTRVSPGPAQL